MFSPSKSFGFHVDFVLGAFHFHSARAIQLPSSKRFLIFCPRFLRPWDIGSCALIPLERSVMIMASLFRIFHPLGFLPLMSTICLFGYCPCRMLQFPILASTCDLVSMDCINKVLPKTVLQKTYLESCISCFFENSFRTVGTRSTCFQLQERVPLLIPASSINSGAVNHLARFIYHLYCASSSPRSEYFALSSCAAKCAWQNTTLMSFGVGLLLCHPLAFLSDSTLEMLILIPSGMLPLRTCQV